MIVTHKKVAEILKHWKLEKETISDIYYEGSGGKNENAFYVGTHFVLKYTANPGKLRIHADLSRKMEQMGMRAAVPVKTTKGLDFVQDGESFFCLTERIEGRQVVAEKLYQKDYFPDAGFIGEIIGRLHTALRDVEAVVSDENLYETVTKWALPRAREILCLSPDFCRHYIETFGGLHDKLPRQIIHRDPNPGNILFSGDAWGFIDFDLSERNLRIFDPCYAATAVLSESFVKQDNAGLQKWLQIYKDMIRGYDRMAKLTEEERLAMPYVILANQLICVAWFAEQDKYPELYETNKQMTQWLVENFMQLAIS